jgi:hypothetical protein
VALRHRDHPDDLAHARRQRHLQALGVGDEHLDAQTLRQPRAPQDLARIGSCGIALGDTNEPISRRLKPQAASCSMRAILVSVGMKRLDGLEAVARRDLENFDLNSWAHPCLHGLIPTRKYRQRQEEMAGWRRLIARCLAGGARPGRIGKGRLALAASIVPQTGVTKGRARSAQARFVRPSLARMVPGNNHDTLHQHDPLQRSLPFLLHLGAFAHAQSTGRRTRSCSLKRSPPTEQEKAKRKEQERRRGRRRARRKRLEKGPAPKVLNPTPPPGAPPAGKSVLTPPDKGAGLHARNNSRAHQPLPARSAAGWRQDLRAPGAQGDRAALRAQEGGRMG